MRHRVFLLGLTSTILLGQRSFAQTTPSMRLTDPHTMAAAARTTETGVFELDRGNQIYVPPRCVGAVRCPLLVFSASGNPTMWLRPAADSFGMIILTQLPYVTSSEERAAWLPAFRQFDARLKRVFGRFAIDPDRIAIGGFSSGGLPARIWGPDNVDFFSRIILKSSVASADAVAMYKPRPPNLATEFLLLDGLVSENYAITSLVLAAELRQRRYAADHVVGFRAHEDTPEAYWAIGQWLHESWTAPNRATRPVPRVIVDSLPILTAKALAQMTAFWIRWIQLPESLMGRNAQGQLRQHDRTVFRRAYQQRFVLPLKGAWPSVTMVDMSALAAMFPDIEETLRRSGLTARQHDTYRLALASARLVTLARQKGLYKVDFHVLQALDKAVATNPVLQRNIEFLRTHSDEVEVLEATGMWKTP